MPILADFKKFLIRGNLVELAVAFVMGVVFAALLKAFIADLITPVIALIFGKPEFSRLSFTINGSHFAYGDFLNNLFTFVTTAFTIFFFVVRPYNSLMDRRNQEDPDTRECPECASRSRSRRGAARPAPPSSPVRRSPQRAHQSPQPRRNSLSRERARWPRSHRPQPAERRRLLRRVAGDDRDDASPPALGELDRAC